MISTMPADPAGLVTESEVLLDTVKLVPGVAPKLTAVAPLKAVPVTVTRVPPAIVPAPGLTPETVGAGGALYVNRSAANVGEVLLGVTTLTSTDPDEPAGLITVMDVLLTTLRLVPAVDPKFTAVAPVKPTPVIVTLVPPAVDPVFGEMPVTVQP